MCQFINSNDVFANPDNKDISATTRHFAQHYQGTGI